MSDDGSSPDHPKDYKFDADVRSAYLAPIFLKVKKPMNVMNVLHAYAIKMRFGLIILSAVGAVGNVLFPRNIKKNYDEGIYQILSLTGRIVPRNVGEIIGDIHLIMCNNHGATVGVVESLVPQTSVEVIVCPFYHDPVVSRRFDLQPPRLHGNFFPPSSSSEQSYSGEQSHSKEQNHSAESSYFSKTSP